MNDKLSYLAIELFEKTLRVIFVRYVFLVYCILKYYWALLVIRNEYIAISALLRCQRILSAINSSHIPIIILKMIKRSIAKYIDPLSKKNLFIESYISTIEATSYKNEFSKYGLENCLRLKYPKTNDNQRRQGDLLLLKPFINLSEKGVIFISYNDAINKFCAIYEILKLSKYYRIVIEPSTWGYQESIFYCLMGLNTDVIIEAQYENDFNYIKSIGSNFYPIRL